MLDPSALSIIDKPRGGKQPFHHGAKPGEKGGHNTESDHFPGSTAMNCSTKSGREGHGGTSGSKSRTLAEPWHDLANAAIDLVRFLFLFYYLSTFIQMTMFIFYFIFPFSTWPRVPDYQSKVAQKKRKIMTSDVYTRLPSRNLSEQERKACDQNTTGHHARTSKTPLSHCPTSGTCSYQRRIICSQKRNLLAHGLAWMP